MWAGVRDAAQALDANLFYFAGGILDFAVNYRQQANLIYERIAPDTLDGLVIWGGQLAHIVGPREVFKFCRRFQPLPMLSIELEMEGIPSLFVDNYRGMYDITTHLIEVHGFTRLAYIDYPTNYPVTISRYQGYADALKAHGLPINGQLITDGSGMDPRNERRDSNAGQEGVRVFLEQRKLRPGQDIEAIVTVADPTALAALAQLRVYGIRVPEDIALVGFDDLEELRYQRPPLTTVRQSFYEQGWKATEALLTRLRGGATPDRINLTPQVIVRRSCGCVDPAIVHVAEKPSTITLPASLADCKDLRCIHREVLLAAIRRAAPTADAAACAAWVECLLDGFLQTVRGQGSAVFLSAWEAVLYDAQERGVELTCWQAALSEWRHFFPAMPQEETRRAETLWQQARILLGDLAQRAQAAQRLQAAQHTNFVREISGNLIATFDTAELMDVLAQELPRLNIPQCYLALYVEPTAPAGGARLMMAFDETGRRPLPPEGLPIPPRRLLPEDLLSQALQHSFMAAPLYFRETQIGFVLFAAGQSDGVTYEVLRSHLSSALQGALLVGRIQHAAEEIRALNHALQSENMRMSAELAVSRRIQQLVLPSAAELQQVVGLDIAGHVQPSDEVGGDYYDVLLHDNTLLIGIGDVTGHGLESGMLMLMTQTAIRTLLEHGETDPMAFLRTLNRVILKNVSRMQVHKTLSLAFVQYENHQLKIVGQHEDLLVVRTDGHIERIDTFGLGFPLGLEDEIEQFVSQTTISLQAGDGIVLYTDGLTEAEDTAGRFYGSDRLCAVITQHWQQSAEAIKKAIIADVSRHIGKRKIYDDLTLVILKQL